MITDRETNFLYLADTLKNWYKPFYKEFEKVLKENNVEFDFLSHTKDIWAVDYMPIQIEKNQFVQFEYNPTYLQESKDTQNSISDVNKICESLYINFEKCNLKVDGGNIIRLDNAVIMCDRVFDENQNITKKKITQVLEEALEVDNIIFIPTDPYDKYGHADGLVRYYKDNTVLINSYTADMLDANDIEYQNMLRKALSVAGLDYIEIPYNPYNNKRDDQANGIYINFLQMENLIIIPAFNKKEDEQTFKLFEELYKSNKIVSINSNDIAKDGGILNCITWNIVK